MFGSLRALCPPPLRRSRRPRVGRPGRGYGSCPNATRLQRRRDPLAAVTEQPRGIWSGSRLSRGGRRRFVDAHSSRRDAVVAAAAHSSLRAERQRRWLSGWRPRECGPLRARRPCACHGDGGALPLAHPGIFEPKSCWFSFSRIGSRRDTLEHQPVRQ